MKWAITFAVSGLHRGVKQVKPFNPILGETSQCEFKDGTKLYFEQLAHHPPITGYEVIGPNRLFYFHVCHMLSVGGASDFDRPLIISRTRSLLALHNV